MKLYTDSAVDLPLSFFEKNKVTLIPLKVLINDAIYDDILGIEPIKVYDFIREGGHPKTSQASLEQFLTLWTELAESNQQGLYLAFSSELSGTYNTAVMAMNQVKEDYPDLDLVIIDSKAASLGYGRLAEEMVEARDQGLTRDEIALRLEQRKLKMKHLFTVEDLDYLASGGRVSKASAFLGGLLNIRPLLHVEEGKLVPFEKIRGKKKILNRMVELLLEKGDQLENQTIGISHGDDLELALQLKTLIEKQVQPKAFQIEIIGSTIASHTGPSTLALFFIEK